MYPQASEFLVNVPLTVDNIRTALNAARLKPRRVGQKNSHRKVQKLIKALPKPRLKAFLKRRMKVLEAATTGKLLPEVRARLWAGEAATFVQHMERGRGHEPCDVLRQVDDNGDATPYMLQGNLEMYTLVCHTCTNVCVCMGVCVCVCMGVCAWDCVCVGFLTRVALCPCLPL